MERLEELKTMLNSGCNINDVILKHFKYTDYINESKNTIAYKHETCKNVSSAIRKKLNKVDDYEVGEILSCRQFHNPKKTSVNLQKHFHYKIVNIEGVFSSESIVMGEVQSIDNKIVKDFVFLMLVLHVIQVKGLQSMARFVFSLYR